MTLPLPWFIEDPAARGNFEEIAKQFSPAVLRIGTDIAYQNGWATSAGAACRVAKILNLVTITGVFNGVGAAAVGAFTLPAGFRPTNVILAPASYYAGGRGLGSVQVLPGGQVNILNNVDAFGALDFYSFIITFSTLS